MEWDVAIVGAGMGGAAFGYMLALTGHKVVFLEKGHAECPRSHQNDDPEAPDPVTRLASGRWPTRIRGLVNDQPMLFFPALGCGAGGSTLLYAGALERLSQRDFREQSSTGQGTGWPIGYEELAPFYHHAEQLFCVEGSPNPFEDGPAAALRTPPAMSRSDAYLFELLERNGLRPYRAHNAHPAQSHAPGTAPFSGRIRMNARRAFIEPALATGNVTLIDCCTVERVDADRDQVQALVCRRDGQELVVKAGCYALAGGALSTPHLLLRSSNDCWPRGVANSSDMVGRNLMFHVSDFVAIWTRGRGAGAGADRSILVRDFYENHAGRFGIIQSTGMTANARNIVHFLKGAMTTGRLRWLRPLKSLLQYPALVAAWVFGRATIFATVLEDRPYHENRITILPEDPDSIYFEYRIHEELRVRVRAFRRLYKKAFRRHWAFVLTPEVNLNFGHACGTCRLGLDHSQSVIDRENRCHDLQNLYIVDGSCFASSGGVNPSLTIAALALRAGAILSAKLTGARAGLAAGAEGSGG